MTTIVSGRKFTTRENLAYRRTDERQRVLNKLRTDAQRRDQKLAQDQAFASYADNILVATPAAEDPQRSPSLWGRLLRTARRFVRRLIGWLS